VAPRLTPFAGRLVLLLPLSLSLAATAASASETLQEDLARCAAIANDSDRLACFDALVEQAPRKQTPLSLSRPPPVSSQADSRVTDTVREPPGEADFGKEHWTGDGGRPDSIEAEVTAVRKDSRGHLHLILSNGQQWRQRDVRHFTVNPGDTVIIERGSMNSFFVTVKGGSRAERFYRVQ
jgi:hypothetical protein